MLLPVGITDQIGRLQRPANTAIRVLLPARRGLKGRVTQFRYTVPGNLTHTLTCMRPINYTVICSGAAPPSGTTTNPPPPATGQTSPLAAPLAGGNQLLLYQDPGAVVPYQTAARPIAVNDLVVIECPASVGVGFQLLAQVTAVAAQVPVALPTALTGPAQDPSIPPSATQLNSQLITVNCLNVPGGVFPFNLLNGARVWLMGQEIPDSFGVIGQFGHPQFNLPSGQPGLGGGGSSSSSQGGANIFVTLADVAVGVMGARNLYEPCVLSIDNLYTNGILEGCAIGYTTEGGDRGAGNF
jgi:hypothetical protein